MCVDVCTLTFISIFIPRSVYKYWKTWVHTKTPLLIQQQRIYSSFPSIFIIPLPDRRNLVAIFFSMFTYWINSQYLNHPSLFHRCLHHPAQSPPPNCWPSALSPSKTPILLRGYELNYLRRNGLFLIEHLTLCMKNSIKKWTPSDSLSPESIYIVVSS